MRKRVSGNNWSIKMRTFQSSKEIGLTLVPISALTELLGELRSTKKFLHFVITWRLAIRQAQFSLMLDRTTVVWRWHREGQSPSTSVVALLHHCPQPIYGSAWSLNIYNPTLLSDLTTLPLIPERVSSVILVPKQEGPFLIFILRTSHTADFLSSFPSCQPIFFLPSFSFFTHPFPFLDFLYSTIALAFPTWKFTQ